MPNISLPDLGDLFEAPPQATSRRRRSYSQPTSQQNVAIPSRPESTQTKQPAKVQQLASFDTVGAMRRLSEVAAPAKQPQTQAERPNTKKQPRSPQSAKTSRRPTTIQREQPQPLPSDNIPELNVIEFEEDKPKPKLLHKTTFSKDGTPELYADIDPYDLVASANKFLSHIPTTTPPFIKLTRKWSRLRQLENMAATEKLLPQEQNELNTLKAMEQAGEFEKLMKVQ